MRIAIVLFGTSGRGGMETVTALLAKGFEKAGHPCRIFLLGGSADMAWTKGLPITVIGRATEPQRLRYLRYVVQFPLAFRRFAPDVALGAEPRATFFAKRVARALGMRTRVASWVHFTLTRLDGLDKLKIADLHLAISSLIARELGELTGHPERVHTVFNPVDVAASPLSRAARPTFLVVGRLQIGEQKRTDDLLGAAARLKGDFTLRIVGDGDDGPALRAQADALGLGERVEWLGWQAAPWDVAGEVSCLIMTSAYEGFGMVLVEALARGVPVLSTDCPAGPADIVIEGENGWLVPVGDVEALAARMQAIVDDPSILPPLEAVVASAARFGVGSTVDRIVAAIKAGR